MEESFAGRRVTVMGLGTFGAGIAATRFCAQRGAAVRVTDLRSEDELADSIAALTEFPSVELHLGRHDESDFSDADLLVVSPAVKPGDRYVALAARVGADVTSELRIFWHRCRAPIVGVTGSNGKSTTATLIRDILREDGRRAWLGGNIGGSLLPVVGEIAPSDWVVLELSSFQLVDLSREQLSPHVAVITNVTPNHLDWHGSGDEYLAAKQNILRWQTQRDIAVRHSSGIEAGWPTAAQTAFCGPAAGRSLFTMPGEGQSLELAQEATTVVHFDNCPGLCSGHLRSNAMLAATACLSMGVNVDAIAAALKSFTSLPDRMELIAEHQGCRFINDSASTTPESTIAALNSIKEPIVLIAGGSEKGCRLDLLASTIAERAKAAHLIGDVRDPLAAEINRALTRLRKRRRPISLETVRVCQSLAEAVAAASESANDGATVLFSPGFSSGSMFRNYADRGRAFTGLVRAIGDPSETRPTARVR